MLTRLPAFTLLAAPLSALTFLDVPSVRTVGTHVQPITHMVANEKGTLLYTAGGRGEVLAWDLKRDEALWRTEIPAAQVGFTGFDLAKDRIGYALLFVAVDFLEAETGEAVSGSVGAPNMMDKSTVLVLDPKGRWAWLGAETGVASRVAPHNASGWSTRPLANGGVTCMALSGDGKLLAVGGRDNTVHFIDAQSASVDKRKVLEGHAAPISAITFDSKGKQVVSADAAGRVCVWKASNGKLDYQLDAHEGRVHSVACDARGRWIATGDGKGTIKLWTLKEGEPVITLEGADETPIRALVFLGKSAELASAGGGDRIRVWDPGEL